MPDDFKIFVGGVLFESSDCLAGVVVANAVLFHKVDYLCIFECLVGRVDKIVFVFVKNQTHNAPMVVDEVGVEEIKVFCPFLALRWKTAKKQQFCFFINTGFQRVEFCFRGAMSNIVGVEI